MEQRVKIKMKQTMDKRLWEKDIFLFGFFVLCPMPYATHGFDYV